MDKLKYIKLENEDGSYSNSIPLAVDSDHVDVNGDTLTNELNKKASTILVNTNTANLQNQINSLASGSPLAASSTSEMTDTTRIYVLTTDGHWYWYDGDSWEDGGVYQASVDPDDVSNLVAMQENEKVNLYDEMTEVRGFLTNTGTVSTTGANYKTRREFTSDFIRVDDSKKVTFIIYVPSTVDIADTEPLWMAIGTYNLSKTFSRRVVPSSFSDTTLIDGTLIRKATVTLNEGEVFIRGSFRSYGAIKARIFNDEINSYVERCESKNEIKNEEKHLYFSDAQYELEYGYIQASNGQNQDVVNEHYARTKDYILVGKGSRIFFKRDFYRKNPYFRKFTVRRYYLDKTYKTGDLGWLNPTTGYEATDDFYIRLVFVTTDTDVSIPEADIQDIYDNLVIDRKEVQIPEEDYNAKKYDNNQLKAINHRGYNSVAPENTLSAFRLSKIKGFNYVETDVAFTSDGVPVLLHDSTINRTARESDGSVIEDTISIGSITFDEVRQYDFGIWKSQDYAGEKIPSFEEFMLLCRNLNLHPYIELKTNQTLTTAHAQLLIDIVKKYNMLRNVTWISFDIEALSKIITIDQKARLGYLKGNVNETNMNDIKALHNDYNEVFLDVSELSTITSETIEMCVSNDVGIEVWTINNSTTLGNLDNFVSGVTSDSLNVSTYDYEKFIASNQYLD